MGPASQRLCVTGALCLFWKIILHQDPGPANPQGGMDLSHPISSHPMPSHLGHAMPHRAIPPLSFHPHPHPHAILSISSHFTPPISVSPPLHLSIPGCGCRPGDPLQPRAQRPQSKTFLPSLSSSAGFPSEPSHRGMVLAAQFGGDWTGSAKSQVNSGATGKSPAEHGPRASRSSRCRASPAAGSREVNSPMN